MTPTDLPVTFSLLKLNSDEGFSCSVSTGRVPRHVAAPSQHILAAEDVVSCCLDLSVPSISFRINGHPVQGMFENFNLDGLFFPVVSFSAGIRYKRE